MKKTTFRNGLGVAVLSLGLAACQQSVEKEDLKVSNATVYFAGDPAVDGCGWLLATNQDTLAPANLPSHLKQKDLKITIEYKIIAEEFNCAWSKLNYKVVDIKEGKISTF